jgi:hypothetical protein
MNAEHEDARERRPRHHPQTLFWASVLIWAGLVFTADSMGWLPELGHAGPWNWVFFGAGLLVLGGALWRGFSPAYRRSPVGYYVSAAVLIIIGLSGFIAVRITWPVVLLAVGVILLATALIRRR